GASPSGTPARIDTARRALRMACPDTAGARHVPGTCQVRGREKVLARYEQGPGRLASPERPVVSAANDGEVRADSEPGELALDLPVLRQQALVDGAGVEPDERVRGSKRLRGCRERQRRA